MTPAAAELADKEKNVQSLAADKQTLAAEEAMSAQGASVWDRIAKGEAKVIQGLRLPCPCLHVHVRVSLQRF